MEVPLLQPHFDESLGHPGLPQGPQQRQREPVRPYGVGGPPLPQLARAPRAERLQDRQQGPSPRGEFVDGDRAGRGQPAPGRQPVALHVPEPRGEDVRADAGQVGVQVGVAPRTGEQLPDDQQGPAVADGVERAGGGTVLVVATARTR